MNLLVETVTTGPFKENSFIGAGSVIIQGISIGKNCIVGAGSVVYKDLLDNTKYINSKK